MRKPLEKTHLRIAHLTNKFQRDGTGHTNSTLDLAIEQSRQGHEVLLVCEISDAAVRSLAATHRLTLIEGVSSQSIRELLATRLRARQALAGVDVYHLHTVRSLAVLVASRYVRGWLRSVSTIHNPHQRSVVVMYASRRLVALNRQQAATIRRHTLWLRHPHVIRNATAGTPRLAPINELVPESLPERTILFVGALHRRKGLDLLLQAMKEVLGEVQDARLTIVGNRDAPEFERLSEELGISKSVCFYGFHPDPRALMLSAAVFVLPSREEGFGNVLTEAREAQIPIVASNVGGIPEALSDGAAGVLLPVGDTQALARALIQVLLDQDYADRLRAATRTRFEEMRPARAASEYLEVYLSLQ